MDSKSRLYFSDDDPVDVPIGLESIGTEQVRLSGNPTVAASIEGKFVGRTVGGPQAVIGTWDLRSSGTNARIGTGDRIYGAFGAELRP